MYIFIFLYSWISIFIIIVFLLLLFMTKIVIPLVLFFRINNYMDILLFGLFYFKVY